MDARVFLAFCLLPALACSKPPEPPTPAQLAARLGDAPAVHVAVAEEPFREMEQNAQNKFAMGFGNAIEYGRIHPRDSTGWVDGFLEPSSIPPIQGLELTYAKMSMARFLRFVQERPDAHGLVFEANRPAEVILKKEQIPDVLKALASDPDAPVEIFRERKGQEPLLLFREDVPEKAAQ